MGVIARNLDLIHERMARAAERSGRSVDDVTLVAVTKAVSVERIREAIAAGIEHLGENRVQEAQAKYAPRGTPVASAEFGRPGGTPIAELHEIESTIRIPNSAISREGITLHMIGSLQRNKARHAAALFDCVHSVDRPELLAALDRAAEGERQGAPLPVLIEVNTTGEPTKSGVSPEELPELADTLAQCPHLHGVGLMSIARIGADEAELHTTFGQLRRLLQGLRETHPGNWRHLSMGMTDDYQIAIEEGATMVRLGRAIFGERK